MNITNNLNLPEAIVNAVRNDSYNRGRSDISVTQLISPPQMVELTRRHEDDITEDASDRLYALLGQAIHAILERADDSAMKEHRVYLRINDWQVSGQFDRYFPETGLLQDYKLASVWEYIYGLKPEREAQLNSLAHLCRRNNLPVNKVETVFLFRDWSKTKSQREAGYPQHQIEIIPVDLWIEDKAAAYVEERVRLHQAARAGQIEPCTDEERWAKPAVYAVMKEGRKTAVKLYDSQIAAQTHAKNESGGYVQHRPGENTRCETYCAAAPFCSQFKALKEQ